MCTAFSAIQAINIMPGKRDPEIVAREQTAGRLHLAWCCQMYRRQVARGAYFLHPLEARDPFVGVVNRHERFIDDITGQPLNPELCRSARRKEIDDFRSKGGQDRETTH